MTAKIVTIPVWVCLCLAFCAITAAGVPSLTAAGVPSFEQSDICIGGRDGYHTYRLPVIIAPNEGSLVVFADGRKNHPGDLGKIDPVPRRSLDGGRTWPLSKQIHARPSGCCDMAVGPTGIIYLADENGRRYWDRISLARFDLEWLTDGKDTLTARPGKNPPAPPSSDLRPQE